MGKSHRQSFGSQLKHMFAMFMTSHAIVSNSNQPDIPLYDKNRDISLKAENIILEEYKFISAFILQTIRERTITYNLYFVLIGGFATGLGLFYQFGRNTEAYLLWIITTVLAAWGIIHLFFFARIVSVDTKYHIYFQKMDRIREFYVLEFHQLLPGITSALKSDVRKSYTATFFHLSFQALMFALLESLCFAGSAFILTSILLDLHDGSPLSLVFDFRSYFVSLIIWFIALYLCYPIYRFATASN